MSHRRILGRRVFWAPEPDEPEADLTEDEIEQNRIDKEDMLADQAIYAAEDFGDSIRGCTI